MTEGALADYLIKKRVLKTPVLIDAFRSVDRADFVAPSSKNIAFTDQPLDIGQGQTISQPYTVAFMFELLQPKAGQTVMDVGSGSGWTTALLAHIVGKQGRVFAVERIPELCALGEKNIKKYPQFLSRITSLCQDATQHLPDRRFDCILVSASGVEIPELWKHMLYVNGRMVMPVGETLVLVIKKDKNTFKKHEFPGFVFVPLIQDK